MEGSLLNDTVQVPVGKQTYEVKFTYRSSTFSASEAYCALCGNKNEKSTTIQDIIDNISGIVNVTKSGKTISLSSSMGTQIIRKLKALPRFCCTVCENCTDKRNVWD